MFNDIYDYLKIEFRSLPDDISEIEKDRKSEVMYSVDTRTLEVIESSQSRKKQKSEANKIIVDVRELRSDLPNILHSQGDAMNLKSYVSYPLYRNGVMSRHSGCG